MNKPTLDQLFNSARRTASESRKRRERKTASSLLKTKTKIDRRNEEVFLGALERSYLLVNVEHQFCKNCHSERDHIGYVHVVSKNKNSGAEHISATINSHQMYEFNKDLPIRKKHYDEIVPLCPECLPQEESEKAAQEAGARPDPTRSGTETGRLSGAWPEDANSSDANGALCSPEQLLRDTASVQNGTNEELDH